MMDFLCLFVGWGDLRDSFVILICWMGREGAAGGDGGRDGGRDGRKGGGQAPS